MEWFVDLSPVLVREYSPEIVKNIVHLLYFRKINVAPDVASEMQLALKHYKICDTTVEAVQDKCSTRKCNIFGTLLLHIQFATRKIGV